MTPADLQLSRARALRPTLATVACGALLMGAGTWATPAMAAMIEISVTGVHDARGHVRVDVCTRDTFLKGSCPYSGEAVATPGETLVTVADVPPGRYAVQAFQDETDQGVVHQNVLGIPKEAIGFSNNAPLRLRGPRFSDAAFSVGHNVERITLKLRRLFGSVR
jgi:uncharacterized protein (DUF2141 family)